MLRRWLYDRHHGQYDAGAENGPEHPGDQFRPVAARRFGGRGMKLGYVGRQPGG